MKLMRNMTVLLLFVGLLSLEARASSEECQVTFEGEGDCSDMAWAIWMITEFEGDSCDDYCWWLPQSLGCQQQQVIQCWQHWEDPWYCDSGEPGLDWYCNCLCQYR